MHLTDEILAPIRACFGEPDVLEWEGEISEREHGIATYNPARLHDVTLFILNGQDSDARGRALPGRAADQRLALIRKHPFPPDIWRPPRRRGQAWRGVRRGGPARGIRGDRPPRRARAVPRRGAGAVPLPTGQAGSAAGQAASARPK